MRARGVRHFSGLGPANVTEKKPDEFDWWDWTVFLLHTAVEVEHALLVQYLYAAYSLPDGQPAARTITGIAREEMGHLLTVLNLLRFIGAPLNLEREDFPIRTFLYPFPLRLEPLTKTSLAKYVAAEMPAHPPVPPEVIEEVVARATSAAGGMGVNRVGVVYDALGEIFDDDEKITDRDFRPETASGAQGGPNDWFAFGGLIVRTIRTRADAVKALRAIGEQGEGSTQPAGAARSHFDKFLAIYSTFPEASPARSVPVDPNTRHLPATDATLERGRITHPTTRLWAHLFNVRYRMALLDLSHALHRTEPLSGPGAPTPRASLRDWTFAEMRALRSLAAKLMTLPLKEAPGEGDAAFVGPPFELPYTLALPDNEHDRWRTHRALLDTSRDLITSIKATTGPDPLLADLADADADASAVVEAG